MCILDPKTATKERGSSQKYGFGIRDPRSGINLFRMPDPGVKKAPDPGSATLHMRSKRTAIES
jgi:hypothetical protein